jgi:hypothetical protein
VGHVWGEEKCVPGLVGESERKNHWEDLGISVRIILKWILKTCEGFDCINLSRDRDKWRAVVNTVMNLRAP